jgi:hypothetical protein
MPSLQDLKSMPVSSHVQCLLLVPVCCIHNARRSLMFMTGACTSWLAVMKLTNSRQDPCHDLHLKASRLEPVSAGRPPTLTTVGGMIVHYSQLVQVLKSGTEHGGRWSGRRNE